MSPPTSRPVGGGRPAAALRAVTALSAVAALLGGPGTPTPACLCVLALYAAANLFTISGRPAAVLREVPGAAIFALDLAAVTTMMLLAGEAQPRFHAVFFPLVLSAGLSMNPRPAAVAAAAALLAYGTVAGFARPGEIIEAGFAARVILLAAAAILAVFAAGGKPREVTSRPVEPPPPDGDKTGRLAAEVRRLEDYRRILFEESADGVLLAGPDWVIREANARARSMLGMDPVGTSYGDLIRMSDTQVVTALRAKELLANGPKRPAIAAVELNRPDGGKVHCEVVHKTVKIGETDHNLFLLRDVGEVRELHKRVANLEKMSVLGRLLGSLAHEINNPLTVVLGYAELIGTTDLPPESVKEYARHVLDAGRRCQHVLKGFLGQYRMRPFDMRPARLGEIVRRAMDLMDFHLRYHMVRAEIDVDDSVDIRADSQQVEQVLINLLMNAVHAMKGRQRRLLRVRATADREGPLVEISDTGCGIPPEHLKNIFDRGFSTKEIESGHGLGLPLCQEIIQRHGGRIEVSSRQDEGTTFSLRFPPAPNC